jgi:hypothetical protein
MTPARGCEQNHDMSDDCVFCDRELLRGAAEVYVENAHCLYASTRDPRARRTSCPAAA